MKRDLKIFLEDIAFSLSQIEQYTSGMSEEEFAEDLRTQDAVVHRLEIIGEAVKNLPMDFRDRYPNVPWKPLAGLRDILIHKYFDVSLNRIWLVIRQEAPELRAKITIILEEMRMRQE